MKRFVNKKLLVVGVAVAVAIGVGGGAFAYWTSNGTGSGAVALGTANAVQITQLPPTTSVVYDSIVSPSPADWWNQAFSELNTSFGPAAIGNAVTLASSTAPLNNVVVLVDNWACEVGNGNGPDCVTADTTGPDSTFPVTMTFTIFKPGSTPGTVGTAITSDTQTFNIPFRPSADTVNCAAGKATWATGYNTDGSQWYDAATKTCNWGQISPVTFNDFSPAGEVLPSNVIYGISYTPNSQGIKDPSNYLNVVLSTESTNVTVGSDTDPGNLYMNVPTDGSGAAAAGSGGEVSCTPAEAGFVEYSTASGSGCGLGLTNNIPAVQFNTSASGYIYLYPGGPGEAVNFSIYNPGSGPEDVHSVTFSTTDTVNETHGGTCYASWFTLVQPSVPVNVTIPAGATIKYQPSGASISLQDTSTNQDACQGLTMPLTFTSN